MSHSYSNLLYHLVFATKQRHPWLSEKIRPSLFSYLGGIVRAKDGIALEINGMADHVHLLLKLSPALAISDVVQAIKSGSSNWLSRQSPEFVDFSWQIGYGIFTVSPSQFDKVRNYIQNQEQQHSEVGFEDEFRSLLRKHEMDPGEEWFWE